MGPKIVLIDDPYSAERLRKTVAAVCQSPEFTKSDRLRELLTYLTEQTLTGLSDQIKERVVGVEVFGRPADYDPKIDSVVRVEVRRLRLKLNEYYQGSGRNDSIQIDIPRGGYAVVFQPQRHEPVATPQRAAVLAPVPPTRSARISTQWVLASVGCAVAVIVGLVVWTGRREATEPMTVRPFSTLSGVHSRPRFSPDGSAIAFDRNSDIYVQRLNEATASRLTSTAVPEYGPAWSPDGSQIAFLRRLSREKTQVISMPSSGGPEKIWTEILSTSGSAAKLDWSPDGQWFLFSDTRPGFDARTRAIARFRLSDGTREWLTEPSEGRQDSQAVFSPDGKRFAFCRHFGESMEDVFVAPVQAGPIRDSQLRQVTYDRRGISGVAWTPDSRELIVSSRRLGSVARLWRVPADGGGATLIAAAGLAANLPVVSRRSNRLAWIYYTEDMNVWKLPLDGSGRPDQIVASGLLDSGAELSPDASRYAFRSNRDGSDEIWIVKRDGSEPHKITNCGGPQTGSPRWSPDGQSLAFNTRVDGRAQIAIVSAYGPATCRPNSSNSNDYLPSWSNDGKTIYFVSDRDGQENIWLAPLAGGPAVRVTEAGGAASRESADGKYLYYSKFRRQHGLFRRELPNGKEEAIVPDLEESLWGNWTVGKRDVFYVRRAQDNAEKHEIRAVDLQTRVERTVHSTDRLPARWDCGLSLSPDERWLLFTQLDYLHSDLMLGEGFR